jgi:phospholipase C
MDRRDFIRMLGSVAGLSMLPPAIAKALAIEPNNATGTIKDVEHVVILMQENRGFDHYFGTYNGVRGYTDPRPVKLPATGKDVFFQPITDALKNDRDNRNRRCGVPMGAQDVLPFHIDYNKTGEGAKGLAHGVADGHEAWNNGRYDGWIAAKKNVLTMGYLKYGDVSYHRHLANAFTICDHNFCSVHGDTLPNRHFQISGTASDPAVQNPSVTIPPIDDEKICEEYVPWKTYPERVEEYNNKPENKDKKRITCRTYQGGLGGKGEPSDNFTDNNLQWFKAYVNQPVEGCYFQDGICKKAGDLYTGDLSKLPALVKDHVTNRTLTQFKQDIDEGNLPNISWIVAPVKYSEHGGSDGVTRGAFFINKILSALVSNEDVWSKTVFIIHYDEHDGYFDHLVPPMPPLKHEHGKLSPSLQNNIDKENYNNSFSKYGNWKDKPIGFGPRVPLLVISPWSKGGWVCSEVFDHTSVLQFLEQRFCPEESSNIDATNTLYESNISAWRRAVAGDLTAAFDFSQSDSKYASNRQQDRFVTKTGNGILPSVPAANALPKLDNPETTFGAYNTSNADYTRKARPLPYEFYVHGKADGAKNEFALDFNNIGKAACFFYVYDYTDQHVQPRRYTVAKDEPIQDTWPLSATGYNLTVHGPNGYMCQFKGKAPGTSGAQPEVAIMYQKNGNVTLKLNNSGDEKCILRITSAYTKIEAISGVAASSDHVLRANMCPDIYVEFITKDGWYDLFVELLDDKKLPDGSYLRRFAGHVETGKASTTDPFLTYGQIRT